VRNVAYGGGFNPRARVGRDALTMTVKKNPTGFNPRARVGRDKTAH